MTSTTVQTSTRRSITFTSTPDEYGRCVYQVEGIGAFTIEPNPHSHLYDTPSVQVTFGRVEGEPAWVRPALLPDRPVVCRVRIEGASCFNPSGTNPASPYGRLRVGRDGYGGSAPAATSRRTGEIVHALVRDWLAREDHAELVGYHRWHLAPQRMRGHAVKIDRLNGKISGLLQELAREHSGYAEQAAIRDKQPLIPGHAPNPATREGQAILRLREQLLTMRKERGGLPRAEVVPLLEQWLASQNLTLPTR
ncbi:hypothetical protein AB0B10_25440 [Micromonospora arborensis]|uniref:hypothetical protein n=1 Tax=Micromonospora arborensis TaxID=2116518 RepID=UPI0033DD3609